MPDLGLLPVVLPLFLLRDFVVVVQLFHVHLDEQVVDGRGVERYDGVPVADAAQRDASHAGLAEDELGRCLADGFALLVDGLRTGENLDIGGIRDDVDFWRNRLEAERDFRRVARNGTYDGLGAPQLGFNVPVCIDFDLARVGDGEGAGSLADSVFLGTRDGSAFGVGVHVDVTQERLGFFWRNSLGRED